REPPRPAGSNLFNGLLGTCLKHENTQGASGAPESARKRRTRTAFRTVSCRLTVTAAVTACLRESRAVSNPGLTSFAVLCVNRRGEEGGLGKEPARSSHQRPQKHPDHLLPELPTQISSARPTRPRRCRSSSRPHLTRSRGSPGKAAQQARGRLACGVWLLSRADVPAQQCARELQAAPRGQRRAEPTCRVHPGPDGQTRKRAWTLEAGGQRLAAGGRAEGKEGAKPGRKVQVQDPPWRRLSPPALPTPEPSNYGGPTARAKASPQPRTMAAASPALTGAHREGCWEL
uniref:uncharacterized protein LOC103790146 n=1 Tax=Callithrix jacchus TaxID=9483 RepID=UPI0023DD6408